MQGVFPEPRNDAAAYDFRDDYTKAIDQLARGKLQGGDRPGEREIQNAAVDIQEWQELMNEEGSGPVGESPKPQPQVAAVAAVAPAVMGMRLRLRHCWRWWSSRPGA